MPLKNEQLTGRTKDSAGTGYLPYKLVVIPGGNTSDSSVRSTARQAMVSAGTIRIVDSPSAMPELSLKDTSVQTTPTEQAYQRFLRLVRQIDGVIDAVRRGGPASLDDEVVVAVPSLKSDPATMVIRAKIDTIRQFPGARLVVSIMGLKERGIELSDFKIADL
jgi:hypothetical protein